ncbi:MAG: nicotinamide-nucleotide amidase [Enterobacteriaceae bacterium]
MTEPQLFHYSRLLGEALLQQGVWVTCAESCTGGGVASAITDIAGSSAWFDRSYVTYSNSAKQQLLAVSAQTLQQYGAVSEPVAREMAAGALDVAQADLAIAVSGIAGPGGGSPDKPVGTVCFAFALRGGELSSVTCHFSGDRAAVRAQATLFAVRGALEKILQK